MSGLVEDLGPISHRRWQRPALVALTTTLIVTALAYGLPEDYAATGVGLGFLLATYVVALHGQPAGSAHYALSLGGILDDEPLKARRLTREALGALAWAAGLAALVFPLFWLGFTTWWKPRQPFIFPAQALTFNDALGQLLVIALPEEAFFRGYLQTAFDDAWPGRVSVLGARLGPGILVASAIFAVGHVLTEVHIGRLAVFLPALLFGWLRVRTRGIGASLVFHAACNVFASLLTQGYGLSH